MRAMWRVARQARRRARGLRRSPVHDRRRRSAPGGSQRRPGVRARFLRAATSRDTTSPTIARCWRAPGSCVRKRNPGRAWLGDLRLEPRNGARVAALVAPTSPVYAAGLEQDDVLRAGRRPADWTRSATSTTVLRRHKPGDRVSSCSSTGTGRSKDGDAIDRSSRIRIRVVPVESDGWRRARRRAALVSRTLAAAREVGKVPTGG